MKFEKHPILHEFDKLNNMIDEFYHEIAVRQGLSDSAYAILQAILVLGDGCTQTDIYRYTFLNKQTVNSSVKKLQHSGLIDLYPGNGRELKIKFTSKGETIVKEKILPIEQAENEVFNEMTAEEHLQLLHLVGKYLDSFKNKVTARWEENE